jgi:hypothetical protein
MIESLEHFIDPLRIGLMVLAAIAFAAIVGWTLLRPQQRVDAEAQMWKEED